MISPHTQYVLGLALFLWASAVTSAERLEIKITEPVGIKRRGYPVHGLVRLPRPVPVTTNFRLLHAGKPVVAQFRPDSPVSETDSAQWWLDFATQLNPREVRQYVIKYGGDVAAGPEPAGGHALAEGPEAFVIANGPHITWTVPRHLRGFLRSVDFPPAEHLRPGSRGLMLRDKEGNVHLLGGDGTNCRVVRQGRMAVALRFEKPETDPALAAVRWTADLVLPGPVSWVELQLEIEDPENRVAGVGLELQLNLDQPTRARPTLVDIGAARTVYTSLVGDTQVEILADSPASRLPWRVLRGPPGQLRPFVLARDHASRAEGWAHVMDRKRCLAIAFDRFGHDGAERMNVQADGQFSAWKRFVSEDGARAATKRWRAWLHFVHSPPQQSATADPQQMQHPIELYQAE